MEMRPHAAAKWITNKQNRNNAKEKQQRTRLLVEPIIGEQPLDSGLELRRKASHREVPVPSSARDADSTRVFRPFLCLPDVIEKDNQGDGLALTDGKVQESLARVMKTEDTIDVARPGNALRRNRGLQDGDTLET